MTVYLRCTFALLLLFSASKISPKMYKKIDGYKMTESLIQTINIPLTSGRTRCCFYCTTVAECLSVNYKDNGTCILNSAPKEEGSLYEKHTEWEFWYQIDDKWTLVFRGIAGNGKDMVQSWTGISSDCLMEYGSTCNDHYRSDLIDRWEELNIQEVKIDIYKNYKKVAFIKFNGINTNKINWFNRYKLITSSWPSMTRTGKYNFFSINGDRQRSRCFFINRQYGGCQADFGWLVVSDVNYAYGDCHFDSHSPPPSILYATNPAGTLWNDKREYELAESIYIYIKRK